MGVLAATPVLNIRRRLAGSGSSAPASGCRLCGDGARAHSPCGCTWDCRGYPSAGRTLDARFRVAGGSPGILERCIAAAGSVGAHPAGNHGRRPGAARTWRVVGRCTAVWMEADRRAGSECQAPLTQKSRRLPRFSEPATTYGGFAQTERGPQLAQELRRLAASVEGKI